MLTPDELQQIHDLYERQSYYYALLSDKILSVCSEYRWMNPKAARVAFSREPKVKSLNSISNKIETVRKSGTNTPQFEYKHLTDIVAVTILCSYPSDIPPLI